MNAVGGQAELRLSMASLDDASLRKQIAQWVSGLGPDRDSTLQWPLVQVEGAAGQHAALMALDVEARLHIDGPLGDYALSYLRRCDARIDGDAGNGVAEGMISGVVRVRGNAGCGAGVAMVGGTLAIYGSAGNCLGAAMRGGEIFARGDVGADAGVCSRGGTMVIGGDCGPRLGESLSKLTIFIRGSAQSLADGMAEAPLRKRDELRLGLLLINAAIRGDAKEFRRVLPKAVLEAQSLELKGEVRPNWR